MTATHHDDQLPPADLPALAGAWQPMPVCWKILDRATAAREWPAMAEWVRWLATRFRRHTDTPSRRRAQEAADHWLCVIILAVLVSRLTKSTEPLDLAHILSEVTDSIGPATTTGRGNDKRDRLIAAARKTVHEHGVEHTTLALVAAAADVPVGNVYYYFKTKDELLSAVIGAYNNDFVMLEAILARHRTPKARLKALVRTWTAARERLARYGCPIGSLCSELDKRDNQITSEASAVLAHLISIAQQQFEQLGRRDARELAVALVASYEGIALIANTLRDPELITTEARRLERWIDAI